MTGSWLVHGLLIACSWLCILNLLCSWLVLDLLIICSLLLNDLFMICAWIAHVLFTTSHVQLHRYINGILHFYCTYTNKWRDRKNFIHTYTLTGKHFIHIENNVVDHTQITHLCYLQNSCQHHVSNLLKFAPFHRGVVQLTIGTNCCKWSLSIFIIIFAKLS